MTDVVDLIGAVISLGVILLLTWKLWTLRRWW